MDEHQIFLMIQKCPVLRFRHKGVFAANNFPVVLPNDSFVIVNASTSNLPGSHWLLYYNKSSRYHFADPLGIPMENYHDIHIRLLAVHNSIQEILRDDPIQPSDSVLCGLYCIYVAHAVFSNYKKTLPPINDQGLLEFAKHML